MVTIIAREAELERLERLYNSDKAEFLAIYGRRRIGKTFLISQYFKDKGIYFEVTGVKNGKKDSQLKKFHREFCRLFPSKANTPHPKDWDEAFARLQGQISQINKQKVIIFLDELPWLATLKSQLVQELDYYWNRHFSRMNNVLLIICGSAAAWMIRKIIQNKAGLYGRLSDHICLQPFKLHETQAYLQSKGIQLERKQIVQLYMAIGGIAKYLSFVRPGESAAQAIDHMCFTIQGPLFSEFNELYSSLFGKAEYHIKIVRALAKKRHGLTRESLLMLLKIKSGGQVSTILNELENSGIIMTVNKFGAKIKEASIILIDEYSYFYLNWIEPVKREILHDAQTNYWQKISASSSWQSWSGFAFETICLKHIKNIKASLGLAAVTTSHSQWSYIPQDNTEDGAQIDLIIDRADNCINLCEIKFCQGEFNITKEYAKKLLNKKEIFREQTKTKKTIFITMITPYGVKKNQHYIGLVDNELTLDDLF
ncbi:MAG: ATP-binding protein [Candidatus Berkiellales bacterium]